MTADDARQVRDLARYECLLTRGRQTLREKFVPKEVAALLDVFNGHWFAEPMGVTVEVLTDEVEDAIRLNGLDQKWELSGPALLHTLRRLSLLETMALVDAIERWWDRVGQGETGLDPDALLEEDTR